MKRIYDSLIKSFRRCMITIMRIEAARTIKGQLRLPGDKSISHRVAIIAALAARGAQTRITNFSTSEDCAATLACLERLGVSVERNQTSVIVTGAGLSGLRAHPTAELDCGNSGSTMRMLAGVLAGQNFVSRLTGDESLRARPMQRIIEPLEMMGARISSEGGRAPLFITGRNPLRAINYEMPVSSAQVKSCLLLAGLFASGRTTVFEINAATRDHTERLLRWFGVPIETKTVQHGETVSIAVSIEGGPQISARDVSIPGDVSSAAFFAAAATLLPGSELEISNVGLNPTRAQFLQTLQGLGVHLEIDDMRVECNEPNGTVRVLGRNDELAPVKVSGSSALGGPLIPQLIDELPILAVAGTQVSGGLEIRDAAELRVKETDRIHATVKNLRAMGASVEEYVDGFKVAGQTRLHGAEINAYGDHRIAMAFTVAALIAEGTSEIKGAECVGVSFPEFFRLLESVVER